MNISALIKQTMIGTSPHMGGANLKLICQQPTGNYTADSVGNRRQVYQEEIILLSVREDRDARNLNPPDGAIVKSQFLLGRFVSPKLAPTWLSNKQRYKAELIDAASGVVKKGEFEIDVLIQHREPAFTAARGSFIKGSFIEVK